MMLPRAGMRQSPRVHGIAGAFKHVGKFGSGLWNFTDGRTPNRFLVDISLFVDDEIPHANDSGRTWDLIKNRIVLIPRMTQCLTRLKSQIFGGKMQYPILSVFLKRDEAHQQLKF
jgi:hypothetical protein